VNENKKSSDDHEKKAIDACVCNALVSDEDNNYTKKILMGTNPVSSQTMKFVESDHSSYACNSSDDETTIETDQQLFLDYIPDSKNSDSILSVVKGGDGNFHDDKNNYLNEYVCIVKDSDEDDSSMANFLIGALLSNSEEDDMAFQFD